MEKLLVAHLVTGTFVNQQVSKAAMNKQNYFTFTFIADAFIQSDLHTIHTIHSSYVFFISM